MNDDAGTIGVFRGASGSRGGRPLVTASVDRSKAECSGRCVMPRP